MSLTSILGKDVSMDFNFKSIDELYMRLLPALKTKKNEMKIQKFNISENKIWQYLLDNVWNKKSGLTIDEMVDDILNTDSMSIYIGRNDKSENNRE